MSCHLLTSLASHPECPAASQLQRAGIEDLIAFMVRQGWALAYRRYSTAYVDEEDAARAAQAEIWRGCSHRHGTWWHKIE